MEALLAAVLTLAGTLVLVPLSVAWREIKRHDRQIAERDHALEEWIVEHHRKLLQRFNELAQEANARGVVKGGTIPAGKTATRTILLYEYREELRKARVFVLMIEADEWWPHSLLRSIGGRPFPALEKPTQASRLVDYWSEGTARNALTWSLDDILRGLPQRATSRAQDPDI